MRLYGGAAAMRDGVIPVRWEGKYVVQELFVPFSFPLPSCSFSKPLIDLFSEPWSEPFSEAFFLGALEGKFSFAFVFVRDVEWPAIGELTFTFTFVSTWRDSDGVCERWEVVVILLEGIVRDGLSSLWFRDRPWLVLLVLGDKPGA